MIKAYGMIKAQAVFDTNNTIDISMASLNNNDRALSTAIDNTTDRFDSAEIAIKFKTGSTFSGSLIFAIFQSQNGSNFDNLVTSKNTLHTCTGLLTATSYTISVNTKNIINPLPPYWKLVVRNITGSALASGPSNFGAIYTGAKDIVTANNISTAQIEVTSSANVLLSLNASRLGVSIYNAGDSSVWIGSSSGVTPSTGFCIPSHTTFNFTAPIPTGTIYAVTESGTCNVNVIHW